MESYSCDGVFYNALNLYCYSLKKIQQLVIKEYLLRHYILFIVVVASSGPLNMIFSIKVFSTF